MYFLGVIFICFNTDCYFLEAPELYTLEQQCYYELDQQLQYLSSMGFNPHGHCFVIELPDEEI